MVARELDSEVERQFGSVWATGTIDELQPRLDVVERSETTGGWGSGRTVSTAVRQRPILDPSRIRRIGIGEGLLLLRSAPPIMIKLSPWTARSDAADLSRGRREFE